MAEKKQTITFTQAAIVRDHNNEVEQSFEAGEVATLPPASCRRWISRGKAIAGKHEKPEPAADADDDKPPADA